MTTEITAVVVAWNSADSLAGCLRALRRSSEAADAPIEIVVVDNASHDESAKVAREAGADLVLENPLNVGFVVAASQAIALARSPWILLANPDLLVSEGFVAAILAVARSAPGDVATLVPEVRFAFDVGVVNSRGIEVDEAGIPAERDAGRRAGELDPDIDVFGGSSGAWLLRAEALRVVGGLEPAYFAYLEDVDLAWRLRKAGYKAILVPDAVAVHEGSASTGEGSWLKAFLVARNRRLLFRLHGPHYVRARFFRTVTELGHATVQALSGSGTASFAGRLAAFRGRRYSRFLRASTASLGRDEADVALTPRVTLMEAFRRKRAARALMRGRAAAPRPGPSRPRLEPTRSRGRRSLARKGRSVKVLVDSANLKPGQGGIRTYTLGLIRALAAEPRLSLAVATSVDDVAELGDVEVIHLSPRTREVVPRVLWRERHLATLARSLEVDVVLTPVPELPVRRLSVPSVVVVHDVGPLIAPAFYSVPKRLRYATALRRTCDLATAIVCVSNTTLLGLRAATGVDPGKCDVIGEGPQLLNGAARREIVPFPYILYVGSLDPRKNVETLVEAFLADPPLPAHLVLAGPIDDPESSALGARLGRLGVADRVHHLGFVSLEDLSSLYRLASAVALPSLYEGFGLPVLEAMCSGVPVVASDIPAVREVAGDAAFYVPHALDPASWRQALLRVTTNDELRNELARRGREAAERFSWSEVATRFADVLERVSSLPASSPNGRAVSRSEDGGA